MEEKNVEELLLQIKKELDEYYTPKKERKKASIRLLEWEQQEFLKEKQRIKAIKSVLLRQFLFPELACRILTAEILNSMEIDDLNCIITSYNKTEEQISEMLSINGGKK